MVVPINHIQATKYQRGALLIEILVVIVIVVVGLMGLMQMQSRLQKSEMESYQRTQAMILLNDMASRISINRGLAASYITTDPTSDYLGSGMTCPTATSDLIAIDNKEWCEAMQGAAELQSTSRVGAMIGGRGCIEALGPQRYMVSVVWQGTTPIAAPPAAVSCGKSSPNPYDGPTDSECQNDLCRRYVTTIVHIPSLSIP